MKKAITLAACFLLLFLAGCAEPAEEKIIYDGDQLYAVAWLGYGEMANLPYFEARYDLDSPAVHYVSGGEYYLIIPRYEDTKLELYRNDMASSRKSLFYEETDCEAFILCCNVSDIFPDVTVRLTHGGESVEFTPYISLKDGSIQIGEKGLLLEKK